MNDLSRTLKKGTLLIIETGEYSDRSWSGPVRLLGDYVKADLAEEFKREWKPENDWDDRPSPGEFLPWLIKAGKAESVDDVEEWHVGSYGDFEP
jgi:hypothetical protein